MLIMKEFLDSAVVPPVYSGCICYDPSHNLVCILCYIVLSTPHV